MAKRIKILIPVSVVAVLSACHGHQSALLTQSEDRMGALLCSASMSIEKKINSKQDATGYAYGDCINEKLPAKYCTHLYAGMVHYLSDHAAQFSITYAQLISRKAYSRIKPAYLKHCYEAV